MQALRLPKRVENDAEAAHLASELAARAEALWAGGEKRVPEARITPALEAALKSTYAAGRIVRGFEAAERSLDAAARGMALSDQKTGTPRGGRVSRLVLLADDGSERFYRNVDALLRRNAPRVLGVRLAASQSDLGLLVFGPGQVARLVLVEHKDAVSAVLFALAADWAPK